jgi:hypothetical protein
MEFCNDRDEIARLTGGKEAWHQEEPVPLTTTYYTEEEGFNNLDQSSPELQQYDQFDEQQYYQSRS